MQGLCQETPLPSFPKPVPSVFCTNPVSIPTATAPTSYHHRKQAHQNGHKKLLMKAHKQNHESEPGTKSSSSSSIGSTESSTAIDLIKGLGKRIWGKGLPPEILVSAVRVSWVTAWKVMMSQMAPSDSRGSYDRPNSQFRSRPQSSRIQARKFHLFAAWACPWAHRALIVRALKGLESAISLSIVRPGVNGVWEFQDQDPQFRGCRTLRDAYNLRLGGYDGRATVPMLWDFESKDVLSNESSDIIEILNSDFNALAQNPDLDLAPTSLREDINRWNGLVYTNINNGVYRCGFAQSQGAYEDAVKSLFDALDKIEVHLRSSRYLCGNYLTLADVRLFTTLIRFDLVYHSLFKCSKKKLSEYPSIYGYMMDIYQMPQVASTCNFHAIVDGYYRVLFPMNPGGIRPLIPESVEPEVLKKAHNRELLSELAKA